MLSLAVFYYGKVQEQMYLFDNRVALYTDSRRSSAGAELYSGSQCTGFSGIFSDRKMEKQIWESHCVQGSGILLAGAGDRRICTSVCRDRVPGTIGQRVFSVPDTGISGQQDTLPGGTAA